MTESAESKQLVVIGSSAGGVEALTKLVSTLPADFPAAIVIAQHLDPARPSQLVSILERHSSLPIRPVSDHARLEPGVIFVIPSNEQVTVTDHQISLSGDGSERPSPSIDRLFGSAASAYGEDLIAVILTGTGSDGAAGARLVKQAGGTVVIENPETAEYPAMPQSLSPTLVDLSVDLKDIGPNLYRLLTEAFPVAGQTIEAGGALESFLEELRRQSNIDFSRYRTPTILRRLQRRMIATETRTLDEYRQYLGRNPLEFQSLVSSFLIKVTEFFRDETLFNSLRDHVLPELIDYAEKHDGQLRFWSAGCATGEEAYSLAILLAELLGERIHQFNIRIFATDLDLDAIEFARRGVYPEAALSRMPAELLDRYFTEYGSEYEVSKIIRSMVIFGQHDLGRRSPFPRIDLVLCRNVLIYFTEELQRRALRIFAFSIRHDGFLALGKSESAGAASSNFALEHSEAKIYRRHGEPVMMPLDSGEPLQTTITSTEQLKPAWVSNTVPSRSRASEESRRAHESLEKSEQLLFNLPAGVVLINHHYDIILINNLARRFLGIHGVAVGEDLIHLTRNVPLGDLRDVIGRAFSAGHAEADISVANEAADDGELFLHVVGYLEERRDENDDSSSAVLVFSDVSEMVRARRRAEEDLQRDRAEVQALRDRAERLTQTNHELYNSNAELALANEQLRTQNQQMLLANEEAQVSAEEIETLNEELQATNEELETLNEELQATVEELNATNEDMQARTVELQEMTVSLEEQRLASEAQRSRLEAVLGSMADAVVVVGPEGDVTPMNPDRCLQMFGHDLAELIPEDDNGNRLSQSQDPISRAAGQEAFAMQFTVNFPDSGRRWFEANAQPVLGNGESGGSVLVIRDITDSSLRQLQDEFMSVASHELRTPLTALRGYLEMLQIQLPEEDQRANRRVNIALQMVDRLVRLVSDLLDVSRLQSGKLELSRETVNIDNLIQQTIDMGQSMSSGHLIEVDLPDQPISVDVDPMRIQQVLLNLLTNAFNYSPESEQVVVRVREENGSCILEVQDFGSGIPDEVRGQIFTRFFQGVKSSSQGQRGLGLGLFISKEIVDAHGGWIDLESSPGEGTTFRVSLPLRSS